MFQNPSIPKPEDNGWQRNSANELEVQWFKDAFIPDELHDIVLKKSAPELMKKHMMMIALTVISLMTPQRTKRILQLMMRMVCNKR